MLLEAHVAKLIAIQLRSFVHSVQLYYVWSAPAYMVLYCLFMTHPKLPLDFGQLQD